MYDLSTCITYTLTKNQYSADRMGDLYYSSRVCAVQTGKKSWMSPVFHLGQMRLCSLNSFWKHIKIDFLQSNCRSVRRGLDKTSNPPQSHLYTDDPSSQPAAACKWVRKKSMLSLCDSWQTRFVVKAMSASVSAYRSLERRTDRPRSFANSSAVSEPLSDTCASRV